MLREIKKELSGLKITDKTMRNFGLLFCVLFGVWGAAMYWKGNPRWLWPAAASGAFFFIGMLLPMKLKTPYIIWMSFAFVLGWFMTRVILSLVFFAIITPMGVLLRIWGKDLLDTKFQKDGATHWKKHEGEHDISRYEKQF